MAGGHDSESATAGGVERDKDRGVEAGVENRRLVRHATEAVASGAKVDGSHQRLAARRRRNPSRACRGDLTREVGGVADAETSRACGGRRVSGEQP